MNNVQKVLLLSLISITIVSWIISKDQPDMMKAMMTYDPIAISLFTVSWTVGMAAMMFPAIVPMVLLYNRLVERGSNSNASNETSSPSSSPSPQPPTHTSSATPIFVEGSSDNSKEKLGKKSLSWYSLKMILFVGCYLVVWAVTGIVLLLGWSIPMNTFVIMKFDIRQLNIVYGILLIISGIYQFSSIKNKCLGYCESPLSFFMRRWRSGTIGALKMGSYHGLYCLGCCWPYFLIMVALGWMNLLWMALFATIIFGEKIWSRGGIWIARSAGIGLTLLGIITMSGLYIIPTDFRSGDRNEHAIMDNMHMDMGANNVYNNRVTEDTSVHMNGNMK